MTTAAQLLRLGTDYAGEPAWDRWVRSTGLPIHRGHHIEDLRSVDLGWWAERGHAAAFVQLSGMEGICEGRISEIPARGELAPARFALDELVYVLSGRGTTAVWSGDGPKKVFEWAPRSLFRLPRYAWRAMYDVSGDAPARLLHYDYLPLAMSVLPDPEVYFHDLPTLPGLLYDAEFYGDATQHEAGGREVQKGAYWSGNFFPDLGAWDRVEANRGRGAGGSIVRMSYPGSELTTHMSVFASRTYKKAHRHGPGRLIVIPAGEGYSIIWREGQEKIVLPWHEASVLVPPDRWFHQHFNLGATPARYLALHPPRQFDGHAEKVEDRARDQLEYPDEDPFIRQTFESKLAERGLTSLMPDRAYADRDWEWKPPAT